MLQFIAHPATRLARNGWTYGRRWDFRVFRAGGRSGCIFLRCAFPLSLATSIWRQVRTLRHSFTRGGTQRPRGCSGVSWTPAYERSGSSTAGRWTPPRSHAGSLWGLGECAGAAALQWVTLIAWIRTIGASDKKTLATDAHVTIALHHLEEYAGAEALGRESIGKRWRVLGRDHCDTLVTVCNSVASLSYQRNYAETAEIQRGLTR